MKRFVNTSDFKEMLIQNNYMFKNDICNDSIIVLDVETTSAYLDNSGNIIQFDKKKDPEFYTDFTKINLLYEWTIVLEHEENVIYGRTLEELKTAIDFFISLKPVNFIIWSHNLSYEFMYLLNLYDIKEVFARKAHKIMYCRYENIEFRCSYMLTRLSVKSWGKNVGLNKLSGDDFDYSVIRTPNTKLTAKQLRYCEHDVLVVLLGLRKYRDKYGHLFSIPLTQTGEVRRDIKNIYKNNIRYHKLMTSLLPPDYDFYYFLLLIFMGGYVHASYFYSGKLQKSVRSKDLTSAYPAEMALSKFPVTPWQKIKPNESNYRKYNNEKHSLIMRVTLYTVDAKGFNTYIPYSKVINPKKADNIVVDNGRVMKADKLEICLTNLDLDVIEMMYTIEKIEFTELFMSLNDYLDFDLVKYTLERYKGKNTLKNVEGMEDLYMADKQKLNCIFGMMVTKLIEHDIYFNRDAEDSRKKWTCVIPDKDELNAKLDELRNKPYKNFLSYSQGIFITAKVRKLICTIISKIDEFVVYSDTDSIKYTDSSCDSIFAEYNKYNEERIYRVSKERGIPIDYFMPKDIKGNVHILGNFESDEGTPYIEFKTLGAKRYAYRDNNGELHITISGVNKEYGVKALEDTDDFREGLVFDYDECRKAMLTYLYNMPEITWNKGEYDEYTSHQKFGIHMQNARYDISLSRDYRTLLKILIGKVT